VKLFILRTTDPPPAGLDVHLVRQTPPIVRTGEDQRDYFCLADEPTMARLAADGWQVVHLRDGWYDDDSGGGVAVWGNARYFELRDTLFTVRER
jgi:hypothetical protein